MLTLLRSLLAGVLAPVLYAAVWLTSAAAIVKRAEWGLYLILILSPLPNVWYRLMVFPFGNSILDILIFAVTLGIFVNKRGFRLSPNAVPIAAFILISYFALWNASVRFSLPAPVSLANPLLADWKNYAQMIFLYFLVYNAVENEEQQKTTVTIMAAVILLIVFREFRNFTEGASFSYDRRASGPFWRVGLGSNHYGAFVAEYCGLLLGLFLFDKHKYRKWIYLAALVLSVHSLFFAYSRGAYLAALAIVVLYGFLRKPVLLVLVAALLLTWNFVLPTTVVERISMTETPTGEIEESAALRLVMWDRAIQLFADNSIFGIGFKAFAFTVPEGMLTDVHSFYLKTAAEQGVIGLVVFAFVIMRALYAGWELYRSGQSDFHRGLGLGFVGCTIGVMITNVFGDRWSYYALGAYFWAFWGLVDRARKLNQEREESEARPLQWPQGQLR